MVHLVTIISVELINGENKIVEGGIETTYHGPAEKAANFLQSKAYRSSISFAIKEANLGPHKGIQLEIKHQKNAKI